MNITESRNGTNAELVVSGRLDTTTAPQLEAKVKEYAKDTKTLILDLLNVEYISSAGLRIVLLAHKLMLGSNGTMIVHNPSAFCRQVFEATGMDSVLTIQ